MSEAVRAAELPATVGETFARRVRFSDDEIRAFARTVDDLNPLHHDLAAARAQGYRGLIASGTHLGSVFMALTATHFARAGADGRSRSGVGMGFEIRFRAPVYAEEDIELCWTVVGVERKDRLNGWIARLEGECRAGETLLMSGTGTLLLRRPRGEGWPAP